MPQKNMIEFLQQLTAYIPTMDNFIKLVDVTIWPVVVLILSIVLNKPLKSLIQLIENVKYKGVEVKFRQELKQVSEYAQEAGIQLPEQIENKTELYKLIEISPSAAIIESWKEIELKARKKVEEISYQQPNYVKPERHPIAFLEHTGALPNQTAKTIRELQALRNQAVHSHASSISKDDAIEYSFLAKAITSQIEVINELPKYKHTAITCLITEINHLIDSGKYNDISIDDIHAEIKKENIIPFLKEKTAGDSDFSVYGPSGPYKTFVTNYNKQLLQIYEGYAGDERRKWGIENLGLCLLLAWTNEIIQQGSGWYPNE